VSFRACEIFEKKKKKFDRKDTLKSVFFWVHAPSRGVKSGFVVRWVFDKRTQKRQRDQKKECIFDGMMKALSVFFRLL
jgi:hypothetical protein